MRNEARTTDQEIGKVLGVITARGGSRGIPRKNLVKLAGKPLLQYTAESALESIHLSRVLLSTDDPEIADFGRLCGLDVPFLRPSSLAQDDVPSLPVLKHAVEQVEASGEKYQAICLLQPTAPLRQARHIDESVELLFYRKADAVVSILPVPHNYNPHWVYMETEEGTLRLSTGEATPIPRRQALPAAYYRDGTVYVVRREILMNKNSLYGKRLLGYLLRPDESVNIDSYEDLRKAERLLEEQRN